MSSRWQATWLALLVLTSVDLVEMTPSQVHQMTRPPWRRMQSPEKRRIALEVEADGNLLKQETTLVDVDAGKLAIVRKSSDSASDSTTSRRSTSKNGAWSITRLPLRSALETASPRGQMFRPKAKVVENNFQYASADSEQRRTESTTPHGVSANATAILLHLSALAQFTAARVWSRSTSVTFTDLIIMFILGFSLLGFAALVIDNGVQRGLFRSLLLQQTAHQSELPVPPPVVDRNPSSSVSRRGSRTDRHGSIQESRMERKARRQESRMERSNSTAASFGFARKMSSLRSYSRLQTPFQVTQVLQTGSQRRGPVDARSEKQRPRRGSGDVAPRSHEPSRCVAARGHEPRSPS